MLENAWQSERRDDGTRIVAVHHHRPWGRDAMLGHEFVEVHLVRTLDDRIGIVDHHEALSSSLPRKFVGEVVDVCGVANEKTAELP